MNDSSKAVKVGLFVFIGLALIGALLVKFSKSGTLFKSTYAIYVVVPNAAGLKEGASVLMAGVGIGNVDKIELPPGGTNVVLRLQIDKQYTIHRDADFFLEPAGFLGDLYVAVNTRQNKAPLIKPDETIQGKEAVNIQEVARSAAGMIVRVDQTIAKLNEEIDRIGSTVLSEQTLTNLTTAVSNLRLLSDRALVSLDTVDRVLRTNAPAVGGAVSNLVAFSEELKSVGGEFHLLVATNQAPLMNAISNIETATIQVNQIFGEVRQGKGLAGYLLHNESLAQSVSMLASNFLVTSSNLNKKGLWGIMWKQ